MRRFWYLSAATLLAACGSNPTTNNPPPSPYRVFVFSQQQVIINQAGDRTYPVVLKVVDKNSGDSVPNQNVILQLSVGTTNPVAPTTASNGRIQVNWTILKVDQVAGRTEAMAFCAPGPGQSFCRTSFSDPDTYVVGPF